jgi:hypothetical protein
MRHIKSERLKKLEVELNDLEQWLKLGLVPKKDIDKHKEEIRAIQHKIEEEKDRLQFLKESGDVEEYTTPKRQATRGGYTEMPTIPDIDVGETVGMSDVGIDMETETAEAETSVIEDREGAEDEATANASKDEDEDEESFFSDRNRWRRGGIIDPDADEW